MNIGGGRAQCFPLSAPIHFKPWHSAQNRVSPVKFVTRRLRETWKGSIHGTSLCDRSTITIHLTLLFCLLTTVSLEL